MKILIDARLYGLENAGLGRYLINLVRELAKLDDKNNYVLLLRKKYFTDLKLPGNWKKIQADFRHYSLTEQLKIPGIINKEKPDITHFPHFNVPLFFRRDFIVTIHDMLMHESVGLSATTLPLPIYLVKRLGYRIVFDNAVRRAKRVLVPSNAVKDDLLNVYRLSPDKIKVTYEGFDKKIVLKDTSPIKQPYFVYAGNAYPHKNLKNLVRAMKILNTNIDRKVILTIASARNNFTRKIEAIIKKYKAESYVKMLGFVPDERLGSLFKDSVAFVFPSFSEGFGLPGLEALNSGTLLLVSNIKVFREIYADSADYFNPTDPHSIANAMKKTLDLDPEKRKEKIEKSSVFVKKYSWVKMADETLQAYYESSNSIRPGK